jgi:hypothetical protein
VARQASNPRTTRRTANSIHDLWRFASAAFCEWRDLCAILPCERQRARPTTGTARPIQFNQSFVSPLERPKPIMGR